MATDWYSSLSYFVSDSLIDILLSLICATIISLICYILSNLPQQIERWIAYYIIWVILLLSMSTIANIVVLLFHNDIVISILCGMFITVTMSLFTNHEVYRSDMSTIFKIFSYLSIDQAALNGIMITIYGMKRCQTKFISARLELLELRDDHELIKQIVILILQLIVYKFLNLAMIYTDNVFSMMLSGCKQIQNRNAKFNLDNCNQIEIEVNRFVCKQTSDVCRQRLS